MRARLFFIAVAVFGTACNVFGRSHSPAYVAGLSVSVNVLNFSSRRTALVFRVDGVEVIDTTVAIGGDPPLVLAQRLRLTPGRHRLELYEPGHNDYRSEAFDVRPGPMTIELRLFDTRVELKTYYVRLGYL
jgi:hypothetical protein